ncbi:hypothetical protein [Caulobacter hibisci]|uniref:Uncharacterized protein n=1 Tax=Caulobacter hibisci TaxID=2035993 RepID=A0ABS0SRV8_9CAUL|nr:hypothetical protein [Caulobacter hibisci]MBI1682352.1 hypothetical protein [Caulobacter hibisci]
MSDFELALSHAGKAAALREEADGALALADFHSAISRAHLRDWMARQAVGGNPPAAPVHRPGRGGEARG